MSILIVTNKLKSIYQKWIPHQVWNDNIDPKRLLKTRVFQMKWRGSNL